MKEKMIFGFYLVLFLATGAQATTPPIFQAVSDLDASKVENLIQQGADVNAKDEYGVTPLMRASQTPHIVSNESGVRFDQIEKQNKIVALLLDNGAKVDETDPYNQTALMHASQSFNYNIVESLLAAGADRNIKDSKGRTPLMWLADKNAKGGTQNT